MTSFNQIWRLSNLVPGGYKSLIHGSRTNWMPQQICSYSRKSAEERLGIDKPKRPLTPFFKFMTQMRPALISKNPGITSKEAIEWSTKHWKQLDVETKAQMVKEYEKDLEDFKKIKELYEKSLTEEQKADIKRVKEELAQAREKRKLKAVYRELGRPKKPMSSYFLFSQTKKDTFVGKNIKEYQELVKADWVKLSHSERAKYEKQAEDLMNKYKKDLQAWEIKMIEQGRSDLVRTRALSVKKPKPEKSIQ